MSLPRYPEYKDSGVEWLGEVPANWDVTSLRRRVLLNPSKSEAMDRPPNEHVSFVPMEAVGETGELDLSRTRCIDEVSSGYTYFREGDVTFAKITPCFENGKGARMTGLIGGVGFGTTELTVLRPVERLMDGSFLDWLLRSKLFRGFGEAAMYGAGGQKRVPDDFVREFRSAWPPLHEQRAIANFLGRESAKIDALIAEQEKLLVLLAEKRQATISHAVTRGLDPNAPMKDSGIPWLGEVPAHWGIVPLKCMVEPERPIMYGIVLPGPDMGSGVPVLKGGNVRPSRLNLESVAYTTPQIEAPYARARLRAGDLIYSIRGTIGDCEVVPSILEGANITQDVARIAVASADSADWVRWALLSAPVREELAVGSLGAAVRGVNIYDLKRVKVPRPPLEEQVAISRELDSALSALDRLGTMVTGAIDLLRERRSALISAAVTGKIDVRNVLKEAA